jgi:uncharacterized protein (DUF1697 family)
MPLRIALMRSVQIAGRRVKMADVRGLAESVGGTDVRTVVATGNLVFRSRKAPATLERELEAACEARYGKATQFVVCTPDRWRTLMAANPFPAETARAPQRTLVWIMKTPIPEAGLDELRRRARGDERIARTGGDFYVWFGSGDVFASKLPAGFGLRALGATGTNRNWNTMTRIARLVDEMAATP